jgi:replication-associated recombination protein RarA
MMNWIQKYRPTNLDELITTKKRKDIYQGWVNNPNLPNLLLHGLWGVGKTTLARMIAESVGSNDEYDYDENYNHIRFEGLNSAKQVDKELGKIESPSVLSALMPGVGSRNVWVFDDIDKLEPKYQHRFFGVLEDSTGENTFIITANDIEGKLDGGFISRCSSFDMTFLPTEKKEMIANLTSRMEVILKENEVKYTKKDLKVLIERRWNHPRRLLSDLQAQSASGQLLVI